ncbi:MAG: acsE 1 [Gemmatimonadetes bacterium]|nr:acsE 1 [Gemmatimonadota bacterium]
MALTSDPTGLLIIGENLHASRVIRRDGNPVKHVTEAIASGMRGGEGADTAIAYLQEMARRQVACGAAWLDLNVDEVSSDPATGEAAMRWLVGVVEAVAEVPLSLDSSSSSVLRAGLAAGRRRGGPPLLNSASLERLDVLDTAAEAGCAVVLAAIGEGGLPGDVPERVANAMRLVDLAVGKGLEPAALFVDPLVLPAAVAPRNGLDFLEAVRELRRVLGPEVHLTGGLSNLSFGLPMRRLINGVFVSMAREAGADSAIVDPVALSAAGAGPEPGSATWQLVVDLIEGRDPYGRRYLKAFREGRLLDPG